MPPKKLQPMLNLDTAPCQYAKTCTSGSRPSMVPASSGKGRTAPSGVYYRGPAADESCPSCLKYRSAFSQA
jgi:hypothetical protein